MAIIRSRKSREQIALNTQSRLTAVRVVDIILDISHPKAEEFGNYDAIGTIFYTILDDNDTKRNKKDASTASPLFSYLKYYPLINEIVLLLTTNDKNIYDGKQKSSYYLPQINMWNHPHHNALPSFKGLKSDKTAGDYKETEAGLVRKVEDGGTDITLGQYFKEKLDIKPLLPYEGDLIVEGRFGNSIRFGSTNISNEISNPNGWSDLGNTGDPITIIRNGQSSNLDKKGWLPTTEDINGDASSIYLTSNQRIQNFKQASSYMDSWGAKYIEPKTIEEALLSPTSTFSFASTYVPVDPLTYRGYIPNSLPSDNEDKSITNPPQSPSEEKLGIDEVIVNPKAVNETEEKLEDQVIQKDTELTLPSSYIDPDGGNVEIGEGVNINVETDGQSINTGFFSEPNPSEQDQTKLDEYTP